MQQEERLGEEAAETPQAPKPTEMPVNDADAVTDAEKKQDSLSRRATPAPSGQNAGGALPMTANIETVTSDSSSVEQQAGGASQNSGRLSVRLELPELANCRTMGFRYLGDGQSGQPTLQVEYANRNAANVCRVFVTLAIAFLGFWCQRNRSFRFKSIMASMGMTVPLALLTITPGWLHVFLDGLFLGAICGTALWSLRSVVGTLQRWLRPWRSARKMVVTGTLMLSFALAGLGSHALHAAPQNPVSQRAAPQPPVTTIIVPYEDGQDPLAARRVYLPYRRFLELWSLANPGRVPGRPAGGVNGAVYRAELRTANGAGARIHVTGRLVLHTFHSGQVAVEVPLGRVALASARLDGAAAPIRWATAQDTRLPVTKPASAEQQSASPFDQRQQAQVQQRVAATPQQQSNRSPKIRLPQVMTVLVSQPGAHVLDLEFDVPVQLTGPAGQFQLPLKPVPAGKLTFVLPADDLLVRVNNATNTYRIRSVDQESLVEVPVDAGGDLILAWQPKQTRGPVDLIV
ncbi:MAG: hypothetical protein ABGZ17_24385, partial [Planctomycetaceae bacterium]